MKKVQTEIQHPIGNHLLILKQGDITREKVDIIINAANETLLGGGGVDGAIHLAGEPAITDACIEIRTKQQKQNQFVGCRTGEAVVTIAGKLPAKYIVHAVGPIWHGGSKGEVELLERTYRNSLILADKQNAKSVAIPSISTGAYAFPIEKAAPIALDAIRSFLASSRNITEVRVILFTPDDFEVYRHTLDAMHRMI